MNTDMTDSPEVTPPPDPPLEAPPSRPNSFTSALASLYRSNQGRLLGGVCAGLAERSGLPTVLVRAVFVVLAFGGIGFPIYLLGWVLLPDERGDRVTGRSTFSDLVAVGALALAGVLLLDQVAGLEVGSVIARTLPWLVILGGLALILRRPDPERMVPPSRPTGPTSGPASRPEDQTTSGQASPTDYAPADVGAQRRDIPQSVLAPHPKPPRPKPVLGPLTWSVVLLVLGVIGLFGTSGVVDTMNPGALAAVAMVIFGVGLTVSAFRGRARGLILPAVAIGGLLAGLAALDLRVDTLEAPTTISISRQSELPERISRSVGSGTIDLRELRLRSDHTLRVDQVAGNLRVILPTATSTRVIVRGGVGSSWLERPSVRGSVSSPELARAWIADGLPKDGELLDSATARQAVDGMIPTSITSDIGRTGEPVEFGTSGERLTIEIRLGAGDLRILDLRWTDVPDSMVTPEQLCTIGGGPRGVVEPCSKVPAEQRVALCINDSAFLVDCREDRVGTIDNPRIAACRSLLGDQTPCSDLGITPIGAELISPFSPDTTLPPDTGSLPPDVPEQPDAGLLEPGQPDTPAPDPAVSDTIAPASALTVPATVPGA